MGAIGAGIEDGGRRVPRSAGQLAAALRDSREYTLGFYAGLDDAALAFPRLPTINPPLWELGHIGWFQEFWCRRYRERDRFGGMTSSRIVDADRWWDSSAVAHELRWALPLPDRAGVERYLDATLADTLELLTDLGNADPYFFELALYHEDMHGEALAMTLQTLGLAAPHEPLRSEIHGLLVPAGDATFPAGRVRVGTAGDDGATRFVFDNERDAHEVDLEPFAIGRAPVTAGEFAAFVAAGGYTKPTLWSAGGRSWLAGANRVLPAYWRRTAGGFEERCFNSFRPLALHAPVVHVNAFEAEAFATWAGRRLPSEAEWEAAAVAGLFTTPAGVWEWTATPFAPYPGFRPGPYAEYSEPWFGDHRVLRGGSRLTRSRLVHPRFRNFYLPHRHDPFAGFRTCSVL